MCENLAPGYRHVHLILFSSLKFLDFGEKNTFYNFLQVQLKLTFTMFTTFSFCMFSFFFSLTAKINKNSKNI